MPLRAGALLERSLAGGYGASGSGFYHGPAHEPAAFLLGVLTGSPIYLATALTWPFADARARELLVELEKRRVIARPVSFAAADLTNIQKYWLKPHCQKNAWSKGTCPSSSSPSQSRPSGSAPLLAHAHFEHRAVADHHDRIEDAEVREPSFELGELSVRVMRRWRARQELEHGFELRTPEPDDPHGDR